MQGLLSRVGARPAATAPGGSPVDSEGWPGREAAPGIASLREAPSRAEETRTHPLSPARRRQLAPETVAEMHLALLDEIDAAFLAGAEVPCTGENSEAWTSDNMALLEAAAEMCWDCPLMLQCRDFGEQTRAEVGVWGGYIPLVVRREARRAEVEARQARQAGNLVRNIPEIVDWKSHKSPSEQGFYLNRTAKLRNGYPMSTTGNCLCQCGETTSKKANYKPGHDARHFATVAREIAANPRRRASLLGTLPSPALRAKAERAAERLTKTPKEAAA